MSYGEARMAALRQKCQNLDGQIDHERCRRTPSDTRLAALKHEKSRVRDELGRIQSKHLMTA